MRKHLERVAAQLPYYGLLELRLLDPTVSGCEIMFSKCNPGNGVNESDITSNPPMMRKKMGTGKVPHPLATRARPYVDQLRNRLLTHTLHRRSA